jgi:hypothetical protein
MKIVLDDDRKMVNFIKQRSVHCRMFRKLCDNLDKLHINNLLRTEIFWISRRRVLYRVSKLKGVLRDYIQENNMPDFAKCFKDEELLETLAYLADIFIA